MSANTLPFESNTSGGAGLLVPLKVVFNCRDRKYHMLALRYPEVLPVTAMWDIAIQRFQFHMRSSPSVSARFPTSWNCFNAPSKVSLLVVWIILWTRKCLIDDNYWPHRHSLKSNQTHFLGTDFILGLWRDPADLRFHGLTLCDIPQSNPLVCKGRRKSDYLNSSFKFAIYALCIA